MRLPWLERIGVRLALALVAAFGLIALVSNVLTNYAFERASRSVEEASRIELVERARTALLEVTRREAQLIAGSLERSAAASRTSARFLSLAFEDPTEQEPLRMQFARSGHWHDADPDRRTTLHVPDTAILSERALRDARESQALDGIFESVAPEMGDGIGAYYLSPDGVARYYPPIDFTTQVAPDFDATVQPVYLLGTPELNPAGESVWTPPYVDDVGNGLLVTVVTPVYANGEFRGVLNVDVSLSRMAERLAEVAPLTDSFVLLVDDQDRLINASSSALQLLGYDEEVPYGEVVDAPLLAEAVTSMAEDDWGVVTVSAGNVPLVLAYSPLPGLAWRLVVGAPLGVIEAPATVLAGGIGDADQLVRRVSLLAILALLVVALVILIAATRAWVVRPVRDLVAGARRLGAGELGFTVPMARSGEFRVLGEAFNRMSSSLAHQRSEILEQQRGLEVQVAERTRDLLTEARERSALEERQHLARELHDSVSQALFGVVLGLQTAQKELPGPSRLRTSVEYASELADAALKEMRALIFELRPEALEAEGLIGLLHRQAESLEARHEIEVHLEVEEPELGLEAKSVLYRVAQEALHNVVKHARARSVAVTLRDHGASVNLEVRDDGRGFIPGTESTESYGLHSMNDRMTLLGGSLTVESEPGKGTAVRALLPRTAGRTVMAPAGS